MHWLQKIADEIEQHHPHGEILIASGGSPSGTYHLGHLRELITADAILLELQKRGRTAKHIYFSDDLDALRKVPVNVPADYEQYLGKSLCDIPAPGQPDTSYADFFLQDLINVAKTLGMEIEFIQSYKKYRAGFFVSAIERALEKYNEIRKVLETISGHQLGDEWSPIQINEDGYLKKRKFAGIDIQSKTITYLDKDGKEQTTSYKSGEVKLDWRIDWPARWWELKVSAEPFGRDHATKGGSYDTGVALAKEVFGIEPPLPVPYDFVNLAGDTKKMSASKGTGLDATGVTQVLPPEIIRFFMLRYPPSKRLYFDPENGVAQLIDEYAELMDKNPDDPILFFTRKNLDPVISRIPFSHLVASYQTALKDTDRTLDVLARTEYAPVVEQNREILKQELKYIDQWLQKWAPEDSKFELLDKIEANKFSGVQKQFLNSLVSKVEQAPENADGEWFHQAIYELKGQTGLESKELFSTLYQLLIGKNAGPRAGWFMSMLPRDWLIKRLRLEE
jgi:lysyl-tRNA synthetase class 1